MILKSYIVENKINDLDKYNMILFYGENLGLINDFKSKLKKKGSDILNFYQDELLKNENVLINEIMNISLFNTEKIIFINLVTDKLFNQISTIIGQKNCKIYLISGILEKKSKLRNLFEKNESIVVIPCYADNEISLKKYIFKELSNFKGYDSQIGQLIIEKSNYNRVLISNEVEKIKSLFTDNKIDLDQLKRLLNDYETDGINELRDCALKGDKKRLNRLVSKAFFNDEEIIICLRSIQVQLNKIIEIHDINKNYKNLNKAIEEFKPKIFWKEKPEIMSQLTIWNKDMSISMVRKINNSEKIVKNNSNIKKIEIVKKVLYSICQEAASF